MVPKYNQGAATILYFFKRVIESTRSTLAHLAVLRLAQQPTAHLHHLVAAGWRTDGSRACPRRVQVAAFVVGEAWQPGEHSLLERCARSGRRGGDGLRKRKQAHVARAVRFCLCKGQVIP